MKGKHWHTIIRIVVLLLFIGILFRIIDVQQLQEILRNVRVEVVGFSVLLYFGNIAIRAYRWQLIFNKDAARMSFKDAYLLALIGVALNVFIPATMGDVAKAYYGYRIYGIKEEMLAVSVIDKLFALSALFFIGTMSGFVLGYYFLGGFALLLTVITALPLMFPQLVPWQFVNRLLRFVRKSLDIQKLFTSGRLTWTLQGIVYAISVGGWIVTSIFMYVLCLAFPVKVSLGYVLMIMPILTIVRLFPFTVNALGPTEVAVAYFFGLIGVSPTVAVLISLSSNVISSIIPGILGVWIIFRHGEHTHPKNENNFARKQDSGR